VSYLFAVFTLRWVFFDTGGDYLMNAVDIELMSIVIRRIHVTTDWYIHKDTTG
jgi:hypothetical protein